MSLFYCKMSLFPRMMRMRLSQRLKFRLSRSYCNKCLLIVGWLCAILTTLGTNKLEDGGENDGYQAVRPGRVKSPSWACRIIASSIASSLTAGG